ncbi:MAG: tRNA pseudouridine(55) synthase TruB [Anaerolineae bacterium]|nr:tRNA pseudouridine(55) synthase TruB [Anaerolineae bacterium]
MAQHAGSAFGFLVVDKPRGLTSHDIVARVRRGASIRQVGHAGTLDPMATGVLVVCIGAATRLAEYVMASEKEYAATVRLGVETDTYDADGQVIASTPIDGLAESGVRAALARFQGEQDQVPPMHSAIKQGGVKLYTLARRGESVERAARRVTMRVEMERLALPDVDLHVVCSPGTYIRSLAHDLGAMLGVGGHLTRLRRVRSGALDRPVAWETLEAAFQDGSWRIYLVDEAAALPGIAALSLDESGARAIVHGRAIPVDDAPGDAGLRRAYGPGSAFLAIVERRGDVWAPIKVFG